MKVINVQVVVRSEKVADRYSVQVNGHEVCCVTALVVAEKYIAVITYVATLLNATVRRL